jgi:farnesyl-diphosphate farnesyltransferase
MILIILLENLIILLINLNMLGGNYAMSILKQTSRTFYIPCALLPSGLKETVCSAYLSFRAIDEIEDSETLTTDEKVTLLREISSNLLEYNQNSTCRNLRLECLEAKKEKIPEVSQKLVDWIFYSNKEMIPKIVDATSAMADRMSYWCEKGFDI